MMWTYQLTQLLAQWAPDDGDPSASAKAAPHPLSFSDLQEGLRLSHEGNPADRSFHIALLAMLAAIALLALILHLRQRHKSGVAPDSTRKLARELARQVRFPWGTRLLLSWVARTAGTPSATLMISAKMFDRAVDQWAAQPTFGVLRHWGERRLRALKTLLFTP